MRVLLALVLMTAVARADDAGPTFGSPYAFTERGGEAIYHAVCAGCHMADGRGATGAGIYPSLVEDPRLESSAYPIGLVLKGRKAMPGFGDSLTNAQVAAVVGYIRSHFGNRFAIAPTEAEVAAVGGGH
jgi:mono/diheme cytochrome c family protein